MIKTGGLNVNLINQQGQVQQSGHLSYCNLANVVDFLEMAFVKMLKLINYDIKLGVFLLSYLNTSSKKKRILLRKTVFHDC